MLEIIKLIINTLNKQLKIIIRITSNHLHHLRILSIEAVHHSKVLHYYHHNSNNKKEDKDHNHLHNHKINIHNRHHNYHLLFPLQKDSPLRTIDKHNNLSSKTKMNNHLDYRPTKIYLSKTAKSNNYYHQLDSSSNSSINNLKNKDIHQS